MTWLMRVFLRCALGQMKCCKDCKVKTRITQSAKITVCAVGFNATPFSQCLFKGILILGNRLAVLPRVRLDQHQFELRDYSPPHV